MQLTINASLQQTQLAYSHVSFRQSADYGAPSSSSEPQDLVELSGAATQPVQGESAGEPESAANPAVQAVDAQNTPAEAGAPAPSSEQQTAFAVQQGSLSLNGGTLSIDGTIGTASGAEGTFSLDLQVMHASAASSAFSVNAGPNGYELNYARGAFELSSTSFSFSLSSEVPDGTTVGGLVKDELKEIRHTVQPLIKDFLRDACNPSVKPNVNKLFRAIA